MTACAAGTGAATPLEPPTACSQSRHGGSNARLPPSCTAWQRQGHMRQQRRANQCYMVLAPPPLPPHHTLPTLEPDPSPQQQATVLAPMPHLHPAIRPPDGTAARHPGTVLARHPAVAAGRPLLLHGAAGTGPRCERPAIPALHQATGRQRCHTAGKHPATRCATHSPFFPARSPTPVCFLARSRPLPPSHASPGCAACAASAPAPSLHLHRQARQRAGL